MSDLSAFKTGPTIQVSAEFAAEIEEHQRVWQDMQREMVAGLTRPTYGPRFVRRLVRVNDPSYLDDLSPDELREEAKRLYDELSWHIDPGEGVEESEHITRWVVEHEPGHGPAFGWEDTA